MSVSRRDVRGPSRAEPEFQQGPLGAAFAGGSHMNETTICYDTWVAGRCANSPGRGHPRLDGGDVAQHTCSIDGCGNPAESRGWCTRHYARWRRHGDPEHLAISERGSGHVGNGGYKIISRPGHPVSFASGVALEHRVVFFDAYGVGPFLCHWCSTPLQWLAPFSDGGLVVDHLDTDKLNNDVSNLVASCFVCNVNRGDGPPSGPVTHCKRGHEFDEANTYWRPDGSRRCRSCARMRGGAMYRRGVA